MSGEWTVNGHVAPMAYRRAVRLPGSQRAGVQARNLTEAMYDRAEMERQSPRMEKPRSLVETIRWESGDALTARDQALYAALLAHAREIGIDEEEHEMALPAAMAYLRTRPLEDDLGLTEKAPEPVTGQRVVDSLERLTMVRVSYDFRLDGERRRGLKLPLVTAEVREPSKGTPYIRFTIPAPVRREILKSTSYAWLELAAFPAFRSRYAPRLYEALALRAGQDHAGWEYREPWEVDPRELADRLGYAVPARGWHYGTFRRDCLVPAMEDIRRSVTRFVSIFDEMRGEGRGRPVEKLVFRFTAARKRLDEARARTARKTELDVVRSTDRFHDDADLPHPRWVARAASLVRQHVGTVSVAYRRALEVARRNPMANVGGGAEGSSGFMTGHYLLSRLRDDGPKAALEDWVGTLPVGQALATDRDPTALAPALTGDGAPTTSRDAEPGPTGALRRNSFRRPVPAKPPAPAPFRGKAAKAPPRVEDGDDGWRDRLPLPAPVEDCDEPDDFFPSGEALETVDEIPF